MVLGIIAEYNPFHNGHLYHILKSKELTKDNYTVAIIGGNFTQRGESSIVDKWTKAEMALAGGIDLVLELPTLYSISSEENFADGAIKILNSLKIIDHISFGAEYSELNKLNIIANTLYEEPKEFKMLLSSELEKGLSFPKARENALIKYLNDYNYKSILSEPNNILGIEYLKALKKHRSKMKPVLIPRKTSGHLNTDYTGTISSSTAIRNMLKTGHTSNLKDALTPSSYTILKEEINKGHFVKDFSIYEKIALYNLRLKSIDDIKKLAKSLSKEEVNIITNYMPGACTLIVNKNEKVSDLLTAKLDTVGVRIPDNKIARTLIKRSKLPLATTSANISGNKALTDFDETLNEFKNKADVIIDGGRSKIGVPSTIVKYENEELKILRQGSIYITKKKAGC